jgi:hypothetical protein
MKCMRCGTESEKLRHHEARYVKGEWFAKQDICTKCDLLYFADLMRVARRHIDTDFDRRRIAGSE